MSPRCDDLQPFVDGELRAEEAETFRDHLASCEACARALFDEMMLAACAGSDAERARARAPDRE